MSSPGSRQRPNTLVDLGEFARGEISTQHGTPPVNVPRGSRQLPRSRPISSAPANKHHHVAFESPVGYSASLVEPVMDEGEVLSTSASSVSSSLMQKHRDAASWSAHHSYGTMGQVGKGAASPDFTKSVNFENECVKIQQRNEAKRQEHATT